MRNVLFGYSIEVDKTAEKALAKLDAKTRNKIIAKLKELVSEEDHSLDIKKLEGYESFYRIKIGNYRIVYEPYHKKIIVYVIFVGTREGIYKEFKRYIR